MVFLNSMTFHDQGAPCLQFQQAVKLESENFECSIVSCYKVRFNYCYVSNMRQSSCKKCIWQNEVQVKTQARVSLQRTQTTLNEVVSIRFDN